MFFVAVMYMGAVGDRCFARQTTLHRVLYELVLWKLTRIKYFKNRRTFPAKYVYSPWTHGAISDTCIVSHANTRLGDRRSTTLEHFASGTPSAGH